MLLPKLRWELTCPLCNQIFQDPLLLSCGHTVCACCANKLWFSSGRMAIVGGGASCSTGSGDDAASEADSGVVVYSSEANGTANAPNNSSPSCTHTPPTREQCPVCAAVLHQIPDYVNVNRRAQDFWPKNVALENLLSRISDPLKNDKEAEQEPVEFAPAEHCQLCEVGATHSAMLSFCEQCQLIYCAPCLTKWHPASVMLARHHIRAISPCQYPNSKITKPQSANEVRCREHPNHSCELYCKNCSSLLCSRCLNDCTNANELNCRGDARLLPLGFHGSPGSSTASMSTSGSGTIGAHYNHIICSVTTQARKSKAELTKRLQRLSTQAKRGGELVQELKSIEERIKNSLPSMESRLNADIDLLISQLERQRAKLLEELRGRLKQRENQLKERANSIGQKLSSTTALLQFGVELLKEQDPAAFVQITPVIHMRLGSTEAQFTQELELANHVKSCGQMELWVSKANLTTEIDSLRLETHHTPKTPTFSVPHCAVEGNALHLVWHSTGSNRDTPPLCDRFLSDYHQMYETVPGSRENGAAKLSVMNIPTTCPSRSDSSMNVNVNSVSSCRPKQNVGRLNGHLPASVSAYLLSSPGVPDKISNGLVMTTVSPRKPRLHGSFTSISGHTTNSRSGEWHNCALEETGASRPVYKELEPVTYSLEVDDGRGGPFKVAYTGRETKCRLEGLQFNTTYRLRVRASNPVGYSPYGNILTLTTPRLASFRMEVPSALSAPRFGSVPHLDPDGLRICGNGDAEDHVILGSVGFSKGLHYWEWRVETYDGRGQPSFGVALHSVAKERMLGLDNAGWAMYLNASRSWFLHAGQHRDRTDGGIAVTKAQSPNENETPHCKRSSPATTTVGVRLDCDRGTLGFYLNSVPHGPIAFVDLPCVGKAEKSNCSLLYPAVSLSYRTCVRLITGLEAPSESEESSDASEAEYDLSIDSTSQSVKIKSSIITHCSTNGLLTEHDLSKEQHMSDDK